MNIESKALTNCTISPDGNEIVMGFEDGEGRNSSIKMPIDQVGALAMTLPALIEKALRMRFGDETLRYTFPLGSWTYERSSDPETSIVTLATTDGFKVCFSLKQEVLNEIRRSLETDHPADAGKAFLN